MWKCLSGYADSDAGYPGTDHDATYFEYRFFCAVLHAKKKIVGPPEKIANPPSEL